MFNMKIEELKSVDSIVLDDLNRLLGQLSVDINPIKEILLKDIIGSASVRLFVAKDGERTIGALTLVENNLLSGYKASIEDVVVDTSRRGEGIGRKLIEFVIQFAKNLGIEKIDLTSRPDRLVANQLYKKIGFVLRDTNVYRYQLVD